MASFLTNLKYPKLWYSIILVVLLIPTYFIHTQKYPDWGDDFAQYIYQGQQINTPSNIYKQVLNIEEYSSPKRSMFFSAVLSIISPTVQIQQYVDLISLTYILAGISFFLFLSGHFSLTISLIGTLCVFYNFLILRLKSEVVPEFLFMAIFYYILYIFCSTKKWIKYGIPVLLGLLFSVRFVGLSLLLSYLFYLLVQKEKTIIEKCKEAFIGLIIFLVVVLSINYVFLNDIHNEEVRQYGLLTLNTYSFKVPFENARLYTRYLTLFFEQEIPYWINTMITLFIFLSFIVGFAFSVKQQKSLLHIGFIAYFLFLFIYPYNADTIKYLIPIFPLFFYYVIYGMKQSFRYFKMKYDSVFIVTCLIIVCLSNSKTVWLAMKNQNNYNGPYELSVLEDFKKVKQIVSEERSIAFAKPFVANLLCDRHSYFVSEKNAENTLTKADYYLSPKSSIEELYPKSKLIHVSKGDTTELMHFYLVKLK